MADAIELAVAYMQVVPSLAGGQGKLTEQILPAVEGAAEKSSKSFGDKFSDGLGRLGGAKAIAAGIGAGVVAGFAGLYRVGETFDEVADTIRVGTGASGTALEGLTTVAKNVGRNVPAEFGRIAPTVADLNTRLGLSGDVLERVASQYLEAGRILGQDVDIQKTSAAFTTFGIKGGEVEHAMDALFRVSQATGVGMNDLAQKVQQNAPAFKTLGFSFADSAAMIGAFDKAGLNSQQMAASLGKGIVTLAKQGEEPAAAFKRITGEIGGLLSSGKEAAALDLASKVFGTRGAAQFVDAVKQGKLNTDDLMSSIGATGDTILGVGAETADFAEKWQLVKNNALLAMEPIGSAVFTALGDALTGVMPHLQAFGSWLGENTWVLGAVAAVIGTTLVAAFVAWTASVWASTAALLANPMTWVVVGIMALIAGLVLLVANWDAVVAWLTDVWGAIVGWLASIWDAIVAGITSFVGAYFGFWSGLWSRVFDFLKTIWSSILGFITGIPGRIFGGLAALGQLGSKALGWFGGVLSSATQKLGEVVSWVTGIPGRILSALGDLGSLLLGAGRALVDGFLNGIKRAWDGLVGWVRGGMEKLRGLWPFSPAKWGPFSGRGYVTYSGEALGQDFAASIAQQAPVVNKAATGLMDAAALPAATTGGAHMPTPPDNSRIEALLQRLIAAVEAGQVIRLDGRELVGHTARRMSQQLSDAIDGRSRAGGASGLVVV